MRPEHLLRRRHIVSNVSNSNNKKYKHGAILQERLPFIIITIIITIIIIILFVVQCWTQASKPEPLKQDTQ